MTIVHVSDVSEVSCRCERSLGLLGVSHGEINEALRHIVPYVSRVFNISYEE
jgi:hypothetical protein